MKMAQSRAGSIAESVGNTLIGLSVSLCANMLVLPLFGYRATWGSAAGMAAIFTVISVVRGYAVRRVFEGLRGRQAPPQFSHIVEDIARERLRQIHGEGYSLLHDDAHGNGDMARAAAAYAVAAGLPNEHYRELRGKSDRLVVEFSGLWPWRMTEFKPTTPRRDLIKSAAMIVAEIGRLERATAKRMAP